MAVDIFNSKYSLTKENGDKENVLEVFYRVAEHLAFYEKDKLQWEKIWVQDMMDGWYRPAGSILSGVGSPTMVSLANCTTVPLKEDSIDSINECINDMMKCASRRQGLGADVSVLRPAEAKVNNSAVESTGVVPWMTYLDSMGTYVGQKGRRPAILLSLKVHHPDIFLFCESKTDLDAITNANISVQISDEFMEAVKNDSDWVMSFTTKHETIERTCRARDLFEYIAKKAHETAEPGLQFIDQMRAGSIIHQIYLATGDERFKIISTNACSEKPLAAYSCCLLGSLNMAKFPIEPENYKPILKEKAANLLRLIDNAISYEIDNKRYGVEQQKWIMEMTREAGLGITNLHQWFLNAGYQYDSDESIQMAEEFMKWYAYYAFEASQDIADEKGGAVAYLDMKIQNKDLMGSSFFRNIVNEFYDGDFTKVRRLRNLALISVAPTGTLSMTFPDPALSYGVEPATGACYWRKTRAVSKGDYDYYFILPKVVKGIMLDAIALYEDEWTDERHMDYDFLMNVNETTLDNGGELGEEVMTVIDRYFGLSSFKPAHLIDPFKKVELMSKIYKWVDAAVSVTYNLPSDCPVEVVHELYMRAWEQGIRAISIYRDGSREGILVFESPRVQTPDKPVYCEERPEDIIFTCAPKRPKDVSCEIHHCKVMGQDWLVLVGMHNDYPYEVFAGEANKEEMYVPQTVKEGVLRKIGHKYSLIVPIRKSEVEYKDIAQTFMNERYRSLTRMISLSLRHGVRPAFITDQLKKADEGITEFSSVVSRVLNKYMKNLDYEYLNNKTDDACSFCGGTDWTYVGGCRVCANCQKGSKCD